MAKNSYGGLVGFLFGILFTIIIAIIIIWAYLYSKKNNFVLGYNQALSDYCDSLGTPVYRQPVYIPTTAGVYEQNLAIALLDISLATSQSYCFNIDPLPLPPTFTNQIPLFKNKTIYGHIFWNDTYACFAFSGTMNLPEWKTDFDYHLTPATGLNNYVPGVECHQGFYNLYMSVRPAIINWVNNNQNIKQLFITGHSLGGALCTICAYDFAKYNPTHYSFAAPRSGNREYAKLFDQMLPQSLRINNTEDSVPQLPPATWRGNTFEHTLNSVPFTKSLGSLAKDHVEAYVDYMPVCFNNHAVCSE